ncbi:penicillin acylase family protein [Mumia xiangluensis]|uniref:Penicillin acylase family protein n=1 Tax=Mumia xiangluensis TaxID=1678900 RepID=A0ABW1QM84_9ACTN
MTARLFRDAYGVPHVRADTWLEVAGAQGRVTALDRGGQIQVEHWRSTGTLAEHIGAEGVPWDRFARAARLADTASRAYDALDAEDQDWVAAYVGGVNAVLPEADWPDWAPLGILHVAHVLFSDLPTLLWREHVDRALGPVLGDGAADLFQRDVSGSGSNAWALHGSRTRSGRPLLAGDPHRVIEIPGVYQQIRLAGPDGDVLGLAFPGVPGIAHFGHAGTVAWGITNAMAHHVDVFRELLRGTDAGGVEAYGPSGWEPAAVGRERIRVRAGAPADGGVGVGVGVGPGVDDAAGDRADESVDAFWVETRRGLVVAALDTLPRAGVETVAYAARIPARASADGRAAALRPLLRARSTADVVAAFGRWVDPVNRLLVADRDGTVLSQTVGRVPASSHAARRLPLDAWAEPGDEVWRPMPPAREVVETHVDANEPPEDAAVDLGYAYAAPYRASRIRTLLAELIEDRGPLDVADMPVVHGDTLSLAADALLRHLPDPSGAPLTDAAQALVTRLRRWDRRMDADSADAAVFAAWRAAVAARLSAHPALAPLHAEHGMGAVYDPWCDARGRIGDGILALVDGAAVVALGIDVRPLAREALEEVAAGEWGQADAPRWGDQHRLEPVQVLAGVPGATFVRLPPAGQSDVTLSGDSDTVRSAATTPGVSDLCWRGSVARWIWDLSDRSRSRWGVPFGAAGDPASPHATDQYAAWLEAATVPVVTAWDDLTEEPLP